MSTYESPKNPLPACSESQDIHQPSEPCCGLELPTQHLNYVGNGGSQIATWLSQFNLVNWLGLSMVVLPVCVFYVLVHHWLLEHDLTLYYMSLYAQLALLLMAWRAR